MTPRNENSPNLTELLLKQMQISVNHLDFRQQKNIVTLLPPRVIESQLTGETTFRPHFENYHIRTFKSLSEVQSFSSLPITPGVPAAIGLFLKQKPAQIVFDFSPLGYCLFTHQAGEASVDAALISWTHYALSPELWGAQGKWMRFHERLHTLLSEKNVLDGETYPGHYPVTRAIKAWEQDGLLGDEEHGKVILTLPWSFSLTGLEKLERLLQ